MTDNLITTCKMIVLVSQKLVHEFVILQMLRGFDSSFDITHRNNKCSYTSVSYVDFYVLIPQFPLLGEKKHSQALLCCTISSFQSL